LVKSYPLSFLFLYYLYLGNFLFHMVSYPTLSFVCSVKS